MAAPLDLSKAVLPEVTITAAVAGVVGEEFRLPANVEAVLVQASFTYGSGGTTAKLWIQTSLDGGLTWIDIMNFAFLLATAKKVSAIRKHVALAASYVATDGTLADDTIKDGLIGDRLRTKLTTTGTYAGSTKLKASAVFLQ